MVEAATNLEETTLIGFIPSFSHNDLRRQPVCQMLVEGQTAVARRLMLQSMASSKSINTIAPICTFSEVPHHKHVETHARRVQVPRLLAGSASHAFPAAR